MLVAVEAKWFGGQWRLFQRDTDVDDDGGEMVVLGDNSDIPDSEGCGGDCGCGQPDMRIGFRKQVTRA